MVSFIKPSAAANMKQYLMPSYGEIMKHALTCKAIGAEVCSSVWCEFVLVKVNMNQLGVILYLNMYVCKFEPIQHVFRQKAFCKESILFHSYTLFYSLQRGQGIFIAINYTHVFSGDPFGFTETATLGAKSVLQKLHYRIPEDVSLCCISGTKLCTLVHPTITAVEQPVLQMATISCRLLLDQIANPSCPKESAILRGEMTMRESTL